MAGKSGNSALQKVMQGGKVSEKSAQSALGTAVGRIANLTRRANTTKEAMMETGTLVLHTAETQGSLFLASMAEGYFGDDKLKVGSLDLRAPIGLLAQGYGFYQTMTGQKGAGAHVLAIGTGVMGSWLASVGRNAGQTLAEKQGAPATQAAAPPPAAVPYTPPPVTLQGHLLPAPSLLPEPALAGPMREVVLTPDPDEVGRRPLRQAVRRDVQQGARRAAGRFLRAELHDDDVDEDG